MKFVLEGAAPTYLREDMTLSVEVETARRDNALVLPLGLLRAQDTVLVLQDGRAQLRQAARLGVRADSPKRDAGNGEAKDDVLIRQMGQGRSPELSKAAIGSRRCLMPLRPGRVSLGR